MRTLKAMWKSVKIPSLTELKAKMSKTSHSSGEEASQMYIKACEKSLNDEFKKLQLFERQNKAKMKLIENYYMLCKKKDVTGTDTITDDLNIYLLSVGLKTRSDKPEYSKPYKSYSDLINDKFSVKAFMATFSPKIKAAKNTSDFEELDEEIKKRIASMRVFLSDISEKLNKAYPDATKGMESMQEVAKIKDKELDELQRKAIQATKDAREKLVQAWPKEMAIYDDAKSGFVESLKNNKNITLTELFLEKNKGKVNSYAQIMKYSGMLGKYKSAVDLFNDTFGELERNELAKDSFEKVRYFDKNISLLEKTEQKMAKYKFSNDLIRDANADGYIAAAHMRTTKSTTKMKELRDQIVLVANEAAKEILELRGDPKSGLNFQGINFSAFHHTNANVRALPQIPVGSVSGVRGKIGSKLEDVLREQQKAKQPKK